MDAFLNDVRHALRVARRQPGVSAAAILSLALGIGSVTAIFSVVSGVLLRPLPYPHPEQLVQVWQVNEATRRGQVSDPNFEDWRDQSRSFAALAQYATSVESVSGSGGAVRVPVAYVSRQFFDVVGVRPAAGRSFVDSELREGGNLAVIVSQKFWASYFGATAGLEDQVLRSEGRAFQVVGVMPQGFAFPDGDTDIWVPREILPRNPHRTGHNWLVVGRLKSEVTLGQASGDMSALARTLKARFGDDIQLTDIALVPLQEQIVGNIRPALLVLLGAVGFLLLVACANVANLMLAQLNARRRELAVRTALGASGWRLNRQLIAESMVLSGAGGLLGLILAPWTVRALLALDPARLPRREGVTVDMQVALFTLGVIGAVSVLLALAGGMRARAAHPVDALKSGGRSPMGSKGEERFRAVLVGAQVALSLVLLVGAGLLGRTLYRLITTDPGYRTSGALVATLSVPSMDEPAALRQTAEFYRQLIERLSAVPGVQAVGGIHRFPLIGGVTNGTFLELRPNDRVDTLEDFGRLARDPSRTGAAEFRAASESYFAAMGIPLRRGRVFDDRDAPDAPHVAVISDSLARQRWPADDPLGKLIQFGNMDGDLHPFTIVGVVGDVRDRALDRAPTPTFYAYYRQRPRVTSSFSLVIATRASAPNLPATIERIVRGMRPDVAPEILRIDDIVARSFSDRRFNLWLLAAFGASAVLLAGIGIYGVTAFWVSRRTQEFGIRLSLGATRSEVVRMVLARTWIVVSLGALAGIGGALALTRLLRTLLFGVGTTDPAAFAVAVALIGTIALVACVIPARRAANIEPAIALRSDT